MLNVKHITKSFAKIEAVQDLSFKLKPGKVTGFLGPNGAGKTTTFKMLTGVLKPDSGQIFYDGCELTTNFQTIAGQIGYLPEHNALYTNLRVDEYLNYFYKLRQSQTSQLFTQQIIKQTGISEVLTRPINTLSKGYKQRVGLARVLLTDPKYLFLDEPTTGLDPNQKSDILELIAKLSQNKVVVLSSHVLAEVENIAGELLIINEGKIIAQGEPKLVRETGLAGQKLQISVDASQSAFKSALKKSVNISEVKFICKQDKFNSFEITGGSTNQVGDLALSLFHLVVANSWQLKELTPISQGLEELFKKLTHK